MNLSHCVSSFSLARSQSHVSSVEVVKHLSHTSSAWEETSLRQVFSSSGEMSLNRVSSSEVTSRSLVFSGEAVMHRNHTSLVGMNWIQVSSSLEVMNQNHVSSSLAVIDHHHTASVWVKCAGQMHQMPSRLVASSWVDQALHPCHSSLVEVSTLSCVYQAMSLRSLSLMRLNNLALESLSFAYFSWMKCLSLIWMCHVSLAESCPSHVSSFVVVVKCCLSHVSFVSGASLKVDFHFSFHHLKVTSRSPSSSWQEEERDF